jgi:hypothetical protein
LIDDLLKAMHRHEDFHRLMRDEEVMTPALAAQVYSRCCCGGLC